MTSHLKKRKSRTLFNDASFQSPTHKSNKSIHSSSQFAQDSQSDSNTLTAPNHNLNLAQAFIDFTGFGDLTPFLVQERNNSILSSHDNSFTDYNENGINDINGGNYRQMLIQQMQQNLFKQTNEMFGNSELTTMNQKPNEHMFDVSPNYQPSRAPGNYVKQQAKCIFKNINK